MSADVSTPGPAGCPADDQLTRLLAEQLDGPDRDRVDLHLETCAPCQARLDRLVAAAAPSRETPPEWAEPGPEPSFLRQLQDRFLAHLGNRTTGVAGATNVGDFPGDVSGDEVPLPGAVGAYRVVCLLGRGGMGVVYKAVRGGDGRPVAVKMIRASRAELLDYQARFRREAEVVARLRHPNILDVYEVGEHEGRPYLALEFAAGGSLADHLRGTPQDPRAAALLVEQVARAVHHAHQHGVIHRDLKPHNILLQVEAGQSAIYDLQSAIPKVADFGLAHWLYRGRRLTLSGVVLGTPTHVAPELLEGKRNAVGPACDIYALGVILYEMLTGRPPLLGASASQTLRQAAYAEPVPPRQLQPGVPPDLEAICLQCLQKNPRRRYASAEALAADCQRFREGLPVRARQGGRLARVAGWGRRNPGAAGVMAGLAAALVLGAVAALLTAGAAHRRVGEVRTRAGRAYDLAYLTEMQLADDAWERNLGDEVRACLDRHLPEHADGRERRGFEWYYWNHVLEGHGPRGDVLPVKGVAAALHYSPDGSSLAVALPREVVILNVASGQVTRTWPVPVGEVAALHWGENLLVAAVDPSATARVWDLTQERQRSVLAPVDPKAGRTSTVAAAFSPYGTHLAVHPGDGHTYLWDTFTGKEVFHRELGAAAMSYHPDGRVLALAGADRSVQLLGVYSGQTLSPRVGTIPPARAVGFNSDGTRLAVGCQDHALRLLDPDTGLTVLTLRNLPARVQAVSFRPDGQCLAATLADGTVRLWHAPR